MTAVLVLMGGLLAGSGIWLLGSAWSPAPAPLHRTIAHLHRAPDLEQETAGPWSQAGRLIERLAGRSIEGPGTTQALRLVGRTPEVHSAYLVVAGLAGFLAPTVLVAAARLTGLPSLPGVLTLVAALGTAVLGVVTVHLDLRTKAEEASMDLRHQLSAYLNVLTMLLAANHGNEGALKLAAEAGDGRLFVELRRRITEASTAGRPTVSALHALGRDLGVVELVEIAASASLATSQGAPVARSLSAKTETLRASLQAESEQEARLRTSRITFPLVAMGLVFMAMGMYPALTSIHQGT